MTTDQTRAKQQSHLHTQAQRLPTITEAKTYFKKKLKYITVVLNSCPYGSIQLYKSHLSISTD